MTYKTPCIMAWRSVFSSLQECDLRAGHCVLSKGRVSSGTGWSAKGAGGLSQRQPGFSKPGGKSSPCRDMVS